MTEARRSDEELQGEIELVELARGGTVAAFEKLVERYYRTVYAVGLSYLHCPESAEELTQEVFLRAYLNLHSLRSAEQFGGWLIRTTRHLAIDWHRRRRRASALVQLVSADEEALETADTRKPLAWERLSDQQEHERIRDAVYSLPGDQREIVLLHYAEELSKSEIARRLRVHPSSVGRRLGSALYAMRVQLDSSLRIGLQPLRSSRQGAARTALLLMTLAAMSDSARAAVAGSAAASVPGMFLGLLHALQGLLFSAAVRVRTLIAGVKQIMTPFRIVVFSAATAVVATALYLKPAPAHAQESPASASSVVNGLVESALNVTVGEGTKLKLSGNTKTEARTVPAFKSVKLSGSSNVKVQVGAPSPGVSVTADDALLPYVETTVENETLEIRVRASHSSGPPVEVHVDTPQLQDVSLAGSGNIDIADLLGTEFEATISGSGNIKAKGATDLLKATIAGSGNVEMFDVVAKKVDARVTGSGKMEVNATTSLDAKVIGSGVIEYTGTVKDADVKKSETGSGRIVEKK